MNKQTLRIFILISFILNLLPSCDGLEEHYSNNPTYRLDFSTDTVAFDTVFSTVGSTTKKFMIYNNHDEPLNIESVMLASGESTGFRMNLDGRKGSAFSNIGLLNKDSMYVFVEITVNPNNKNQPLLIQDSILFTVNGIRQSVLLEAYGQDVHLYKGGVTFSNDTVLISDKPYLIYDSLIISQNVSVKIEKGATFYMHDKAKVNVHGTMKALGTIESPIVFRGDRLDFILDEILPYDHTPGQWDGISFKTTSFNNEWKHVIVRNGTSGIYCEPSSSELPKIKIENSLITNMGKDLFCAINANVIATNSEFSNAGGSVLTLAGGNYYFAHCTVTNFMSLIKRQMRDGISLLDSKCLYLLDNISMGEHNPYPITQATFDNCIIDGSLAAGDFINFGEIEIASLNDSNIPEGENQFNYRFNHCLLKAKEINNAHFNKVSFISKSLSYLMKGEKKDKYAFDFHLDSVSVKNIISPDIEITKKYPIDRLGVNRLKNPEGPTIGAYEYINNEKNVDK